MALSEDDKKEIRSIVRDEIKTIASRARGGFTLERVSDREQAKRDIFNAMLAVISNIIAEENANELEGDKE